jgi:hypothetical protein
MLYYICSLPNPGTKGIPHHLFYRGDDDGRALAEKFAQRENKPGRGIYYCIAALKDGARSRCKDTVAALDQIPADLDLTHIVQPRDEIMACLKQMILRPSEIRDSGFGLHALWYLKEPVDDERGLSDAEALMKWLAELLAGDPAVAHRATLLRLPGTDNTKDGNPRKCCVIEKSDAIYDISELVEMCELYDDRRLLTRREVPKANGHDTAADVPDNKEPIDVDARLANMSYKGAGLSGIHVTQVQCTASLLRSGVPVEDVVAHVLQATRRAVANDPRVADWDWTAEQHAIETMCYGFINKNRELASLLPDKLFAAWQDRLDAGKGHVKVVHSPRTGWYVWCYANAKEEEAPAAKRSNDRGKAEDRTEKRAAPKFVIRPFVPFDPATLPPRQWLYGRHYQRRTVSATIAPGGFGKTTFCMVETVAMATCRNLLGEQPTERLRAWYHNGEDTLEELNRRLGAICLHYNIPQEELRDWFFMTSGNEVPLRVASGYSDLKIDKPLIECITGEIARNQIDVAVLDPLVTLHGVPEQDNTKVDTVIRIFASIADGQDCGIELAHHTRKLPAGANGADYVASDIRGATATRDAVRAARMLNHMTEKDAEAAGIAEHERRRISA